MAARLSTSSNRLNCWKCRKRVTDLDHDEWCSRCRKPAHSKCAGFDDGSFKAFSKVKQLVILHCPDCTEFMAGLEARVASIESKLATQGAPSNINPDPSSISAIVTQVIEAILPRTTQLMNDMVQEIIEHNGKKSHLVVVGLDESLEVKEYVLNGL